MNMTNQTDSQLDIHNLAEVEDAKLRQKTGKSYSQGQLIRRRFFTHRAAMISTVFLILIFLLAFTSIGFAGIPGWWDKSYTQTAPSINGGAPSLSIWPTWLGGPGVQIGEHPFGQDTVGRDYFALVMRGTQQSLIIALIVGLVSTAIGVIIGAISGYFRGWLDTILMRLTDLVIVIPLLVMAAVLGQMSSTLQGGIIPLALVLGLVTWTSLARLIRAEVLSLREKEFVSAAMAMGARPWRVILKHLIPNTIGIIVVNATFAIAAAILLETTLSYLGFGVKAPESSLGLLISNYEAAFTTRPWLFWWPGMVLLGIALSVNFIGDGLRDAFDPRQGSRSGARRLKLIGFAKRKEILDESLASAPGTEPQADDTQSLAILSAQERRDNQPPNAQAPDELPEANPDQTENGDLR